MGNLMIFPSLRGKLMGPLGELRILSYTGDYEIAENGEIRFLTSGDLILENNCAIDVFLVGGGAAGRAADVSFTGAYIGGHGGGGGYTKTARNVVAHSNMVYPIIVGDGGNDTYGNGGDSQGFGAKASGGKCYGLIGNPATIQTPDGGSGGGGIFDYSVGGTGGIDGGDGTGTNAGHGQGSTTRAFGEAWGQIFADGGAGGTSSGDQFAEGGVNGGGADPNGTRDGRTNTGGGGAGGSWCTQEVDMGDGSFMVEVLTCAPGNGGSGIVIIRKAVT